MRDRVRTSKHIRVDQTPNQTNGCIQPLHRLRDEIDDSCFSTLLLTGPFCVTTLLNEVLHPEENTRGHTEAEWQ